ncbi:GNAT family N-acetyltransferase [Lactococcus protaetiae]|uniref:GNAT family N-acetyltransferase n=1 Tax=Lactococcus protaetiae TaxID=2592653 RepID=A0A514Z9G0_9LACT|nr:GNAT family N-acetyltransferase [Lactococcus protaetiae]MCL2113357.1 GNAT family N-acetyltransferase [Streptococcaceae bacterium]QDK71214.1 GNAT family N-acetyltransferase [Lactococcus protaetiae]
MRIRAIDISDAQIFWELKKQLDTETKFMMLEPDERKFVFGETIGQIARMDYLIGAEVDGKLVGYLSAKCGKANRIKQTAYIVVGVLEDFQHQGLGGRFFDELDEWAKEKKLKRLELTVMSRNTTAIALYQKHGFAIEGVRRQSMCVDDEFIDEFYMSKIFE